MCLDTVSPSLQLQAIPSPSTPTAFPFKKGDKVRILRRAATKENGWNNAWTSAMDKAIGKVGTVTLVIPRDKDVTVEVPGIDNNFGYPAFVLDLVNETVTSPAEAVTTVTTKKIAPKDFAPGQRVRVDYPGASVWNGEGVVDYVSAFSGTVVVKFNRPGLDRGGFNKEFVTILEDAPATKVLAQPEIQPTLEVKPGPTQKAVVLQVARELAVSLAKQKPGKTVSMDEVQDGLAKRGFSSADLGNAAGVVFKGGQFKNTGFTEKSLRAGNNRRKITIWQYIGDGVPAPTVSAPASFIVQVSRDKGVNWERSKNKASDGQLLQEKEFSTFEAAAAEAQLQQRKMPYYTYQAAPLNTPELFIVQVQDSGSNDWRRSSNVPGTYSREEAEKHAAAQHTKNGLIYRAVPQS